MITEFANNYHEKMFPGYVSSFLTTDPEFIEIFDNFAFDEIIQMTQDTIDESTRFLTILAMLVGCQGIDEFKAMVPPALRFGVTPTEIKEMIYQATAYLGIGRVFPFLKVSNAIFQELGISLPLEKQSTVEPHTRLQDGERAQVAILGEHMQHFWQSDSTGDARINKLLTTNCFGDYYTRGGLTAAQRELITFCFLVAQGGCEKQLASHVLANIKNGNDKDTLLAVLIANIPYIGYPRTLNALNCIIEVVENV